jgi:hypothetical protein
MQGADRPADVAANRFAVGSPAQVIDALTMGRRECASR